MAPKKKVVEPEVPEIPEEPPEEEDLVEHVPSEKSRILEDLDWKVVTMPASGKRYYYSQSRHEARIRPPYHHILGLEESEYRSLQKADLWKAFFARRSEFKKEFENGALSEELKDPADQHDWALVMEAFNVLSDNEARAAYEEENLATHAKEQLVGLRVQHEVRVRREPLDALQAAEGFLSGSPSLAEDVRVSAEKRNILRLAKAGHREDVTEELRGKIKQVFASIVQKCTRVAMLDSILREVSLVDLNMLIDVAQQLVKLLPTDADGKKAFVRSGGLFGVLEFMERAEAEFPDLASAFHELLALYPADCAEHLPADPEAVLRAMEEAG
eukprot:TRINITY_DN74126_c0_g1_i1.p2 TRINITY_DN74126_c0_g1~~TRINITY_DN74126_c0_g1_i1.p2  ORF type:complete len:329 (+),score=104.73 TRINITY_DN74126_c0_g1_i1:70-1056(+)